MIHEHRNTRMRNRNLYVLTGGPGGGKSTVLDILDGMGYHTVREAGRKIIRSQAETGGNAVPWADTARYARLRDAFEQCYRALVPVYDILETMSSHKGE